MGRKRKLTPEQHAELARRDLLYRQNHPDRTCAELEISTKTYYSYLTRRPSNDRAST